jgi:hypothetical protein
MVARGLIGLSVLSLGAVALLVALEVIRPPDEMEARFRQGVHHLEATDWEDAARAFRLVVVASDTTLRFAALHNLALASLEMARAGEGRRALAWAEEAVRHGEEALRIRPGSRDTAWNLEMALEREGELRQERKEEGVEDASRLLSSFRLQEEGALAGALQERMGGVGREQQYSGTRGPAW